jgi:mono/diheme cytochrome c family protein
MLATLGKSAMTMSAITVWAACLVVVQPHAVVGAAADGMSAAREQALVQKHCAVCHNDAHLNGGLSLEHFDAASPDPTIAAMVLSKVRDGGAMAAAAIPLPDAATVTELVAALTTQARTSNAWHATRTLDPITRAAMVTVATVREAPLALGAPKRFAGDNGAPDLYRLALTCNLETHEGEMLLAWSPGSPSKGSRITAVVDGGARSSYLTDDGERMFKGATGTMGVGAILLSVAPPLPRQSLTINNLFQPGSVVFPFSDLSEDFRRDLTGCFTSGRRGDDAHRE